MFRYGEKVVIRDGSMLDGTSGIVYRVKNGEVQVLLDREVYWMVLENRLERVWQERPDADNVNTDDRAV